MQDSSTFPRALKQPEATPTGDGDKPSRRGKASGAGRKSGAAPRYLSVANDLAQAIASGQYPVGSTLPTEMELCDVYKVSRFTIREAMRRLREAGIVTRRPKAGTLVLSARGTKPYTQSVDSLEDLRQYANDTEIRMVYLGEETVEAELAQTIPVTIGERWHVGLAVRYESKTKLPLCLTRIYVNPDFDEIPRWIDAGKDALYKMIEDHYGISVARVEQRIYAVSLAPDDALHLQSKPNTPALRNIRLYYDDGGRLIQASDNLHPGDRFSYAMSIKRST